MKLGKGNLKQNRGNKKRGRNRAGFVDQSIEEQREFILNEKTPFTTTEEYKALRTNLSFSVPDVNGCKVIGYSSAEAGDGKTINCLNTAIAFAQAGSKVLLADCDLRLPKVNRILDLEVSPGLSNILVNQATVEECLRHLEKEDFSLDVLSAGDIPPNPSELLGSEKFDEIMKELRDAYEYIFLDTPPITVVADAVILSEQMEGIVLVVRSNKTDSRAVRAALQNLELAKAKVLGFILNDITPRRGLGGRYGKYGGYNRYGYGYGGNGGYDRSESLNQSENPGNK